MRIALYARVSRVEDMNVDNQLIQLRDWASKSGHEIVGEFSEEISSRKARPKKEELLKRLRLKTIDGVAFVSLDRWGRSMNELVNEFTEAVDRGWTFVSLKEGLSLDTSAGRLYANLLAMFADFERERIRERTIAGLARAKAQGKKLGRPSGSKDSKTRTRAPNAVK